MTKGEEFRDDAIAHFTNRAKYKYDKGQDEHGGYIVDRVDWDEIEDEVIDLYFYTRALREKIELLTPPHR
jgi:hypothetical protein